MPQPNCPICGASSSPAFTAGEHRMYRCTTCRAAFVWPVPSAEALARFYSQYHLADCEGGSYDQIESRMQADFPTKVAMVRRFVSQPGARVLDLGCGKGHFVRACMDAGLDAEGVDLSDTAVRHAVEQLKVRATCGQFAEIRPSLGRFDAITFWATIEHLPDPIGMLREIHQALEPGGYLFLDTGIGDDRLDRMLPGCVQWYDPPQHLFVFSEQGMRQALSRAGFEIVELDCNFERNGMRRLAKTIRNYSSAALLRLAGAAGRLHQGPFSFTRFPIGNLMSAVARKS